MNILKLSWTYRTSRIAHKDNWRIPIYLLVGLLTGSMKCIFQLNYLEDNKVMRWIGTKAGLGRTITWKWPSSSGHRRDWRRWCTSCHPSLLLHAAYIKEKNRSNGTLRFTTEWKRCSKTFGGRMKLFGHRHFLRTLKRKANAFLAKLFNLTDLN